jgi:hypothetical protein
MSLMKHTPAERKTEGFLTMDKLVATVVEYGLQSRINKELKKLSETTDLIEGKVNL